MLIHETLPGQNLKKQSNKQSKNLTIKKITNRIEFFSLEKNFSKRFVIKPG
jgi:hypothetical protein